MLKLGLPYLGGGGGAASYHDGIGLDFTTGVYYTRPTGGVVNRAALTSLFTFTGGNQSKYMGAGGLLVSSSTNTPRIEYQSISSPACLGLLMEASRTNIWTQSEDFSTTWSPSNITVVTNQVAAPDGATTADFLKEASGVGTKNVSNNVALAASTTYTQSVFAKAKERSWLYIQAQTPDGVFRTGWFNLFTGVVGTVSNCTSTITSYPNGWYRCTITHTGGAGAGSPVARLGPTDADNVTSYTGDGTSGLYVWGAQIEAAAFASSYIPTTTVSVTRTADNCVRTLSTEFSATVGTVVVDVADFQSSDVSVNNAIASFDDATANNRFTLQRTNTAGAMRLNVFTAAVNQASIDGFSAISTARAKLAAAWAVNDFAISGNGGAVAPDNLGTLPAVTQLSLGARLTAEQLQGHIRTFDYYPTRLPNTYLVSAST